MRKAIHDIQRTLKRSENGFDHRYMTVHIRSARLHFLEERVDFVEFRFHFLQTIFETTQSDVFFRHSFCPIHKLFACASLNADAHSDYCPRRCEA